MSVLFFRTETTAFARTKLSPADQKQPRVMLLSAVAFDKNRRECGFQFDLIRPDGWTAHKDATDIHGLTAKYCDQNGVRVRAALATFMDRVRCASEIVSFGLEFHSFMIDVEIARLGEAGEAAHRDWHRPGLKRTCAMMAAGNFANAGKALKLADAHRILVEDEFDDRRNPIETIRAVARIHFATNDRSF